MDVPESNIENDVGETSSAKAESGKNRHEISKGKDEEEGEDINVSESESDLVSLSAGDSDTGDADSDEDDDSDMLDEMDSEEGEENKKSGSNAEGAEGEGIRTDDCGSDVEEEDEDEVVKAIREAKKKKQLDHPPNIQIDSWVTDISFHPEQDLIAVSSMDGDITVHHYSTEGNENVTTLNHHKKTCRDIEFDEDGKLLYSASKDLTVQIVDMETSKIKRKYSDAHEVPISSMHVIDDYCLATGDDDGIVKVWDHREQNPVMMFRNMDDYITDIITRDCKDLLICSSGEGTITAFNLKAKRMEMQSDIYENEFNSLGVIKMQSKLVAGNCVGKLYFFTWGQFEHHNDVQKGHPSSINSLIPVTENLVVTGCEDGVIRAVHLFPHHFLGVVGQHDCSVEKMDVSNSGHLIASSSSDQEVKFWNIKYLEDKELIERPKPLLYRGKKKKALKQALLKEKEYHLQSSRVRNTEEFFSDL